MVWNNRRCWFRNFAHKNPCAHPISIHGANGVQQQLAQSLATGTLWQARQACKLDQHVFSNVRHEEGCWSPSTFLICCWTKEHGRRTSCYPSSPILRAAAVPAACAEMTEHKGDHTPYQGPVHPVNSRSHRSKAAGVAVAALRYRRLLDANTHNQRCAPHATSHVMHACVVCAEAVQGIHPQ